MAVHRVYNGMHKNFVLQINFCLIHCCNDIYLLYPTSNCYIITNLMAVLKKVIQKLKNSCIFIITNIFLIFHVLYILMFYVFQLLTTKFKISFMVCVAIGSQYCCAHSSNRPVFL